MTITQTNESQTITYPTRKSAKIAIIGGGSPYCAGLMKSFARTLAANPLVMSYSKAEEVYDGMAAAEAQYLPERLLK